MLLSPWNSGKHFWPHAIFFFFYTKHQKNVDYVLCAKNKRSFTMHEHVKMNMKTNHTKHNEYENYDRGITIFNVLYSEFDWKIKKSLQNSMNTWKLTITSWNPRRKHKFLQSSTEEGYWIMVSACVVRWFGCPTFWMICKWLTWNPQSSIMSLWQIIKQPYTSIYNN